MSKQCDLFLIDGFSLLFRAYYGYPPNLTTPSGVPINAVYGFVTLMLNAIKQFNPTYFGICLDRKEPTYRHDIYPEYKANRSDPDEEFLVQIPEFKRVIESFNIPLLELPGYESDDLLGTLSKKMSNDKVTTYIMSGDMDMLQLISEHTHIVMNKKGVSNYIIYNLDELNAKYELTPDQFIDFKALKGDASDNIPGVKGVGEKTALMLLKEYSSLDGIYQNINNIASKSVQKKLIDNKEMAFLSKKLVTIDLDAPIDISLESFLFQPNWQNVANIFSEYEFKRLIDRIHDFTDSVDSESDDDNHESQASVQFVQTSYQIIENEAQLSYLLPLLNHEFAFDLETTSLDTRDAEIVAISITCSRGISFVLDCRQNNDQSLTLFENDKVPHPFLTILKPIFENPNIKKIIHNAKYEIQVLETYDIHLKGVHFDTMIAAHLLNYSSIGLKVLANECYGFEMKTFDSMVKKGESILDVSFDVLASYAADDSNVTYHLFLDFSQRFDENLTSLFYDLEIPLVHVLSKIEMSGVQCDIQYLQRLSKDYHQKLSELQNSIYELSNNDTFNINSTQQLADVLFDQMGLPVIKKTKTSRSTDSSVLEKLAVDYPIAKEILNYRTYKKLLSTYIDRLPELVHSETQKIHTSFNQAVTATGRLSSNHPNLQNIPVRSEEGQKIRCSFISRFDSIGEILAVDYSQIELRVLAHLAQDDAMITAFLKGEDIHQSTAAKIFQVAYNDVTKVQREQAKTVNFGITYGQSAFALADQLGISRTEAADIIDAYYTQFASIRSFMDNVVKDARNNGFVKTLFGRKRLIADLDSPNRSLQGNAQRIAINTTVQGSAADIIKKAMVMIHDQTNSFKSKMVMQVHDELVFDVLKKESKKLTPLVVELMQSAVKLDVPLVVDVECGISWGQVA